MLILQARYSKLLHIFALVTLGLILTIPLISHGFFDAQDLPYHLKWSKHFSAQFWEGDLYPRWLLDMNAGLGSPTFFFYAPLPYYFTSLFHPLFANNLQEWYQLSLSTSLAMAASGLAAYLWLKSFTNQNSALIASILYMVLPYHLAVNLYWRFALAEYWALVWLPLILYFSKKLTSGHKLSIIGFAVSYALLVMTHLPTLVIFSAVPLGYVVSIASRRQRKKSLIHIVVAMILGVGLSAIYWLPAMTTQDYISMNAILEKGYFYGNNFLFSDQVAIYHNKNFWMYLEMLTMFMGGLASCAFIIIRNNALTNVLGESNYWIIVAIIAVFMMLPLSRPIWDVLPAVQRIQLPWRFNTLLLIANTALLALAIYSLKQPVKFYSKTAWAILIFLILSLLLSNFIVIKQRLKPRPNYVVDTALAVSMEEASEYRPRWVKQELFQSDTVVQLTSKFTKASVTVGQGSFLIQRWKPRDIILQTSAITDIWVTINQFYYPGWTARLKSESRVIPVQPLEPEGLLRVKVPPGKHEVMLTLDAGVEERTAQIISTISVMLTVFLIFWFRKVDRNGISCRL